MRLNLRQDGLLGVVGVLPSSVKLESVGDVLGAWIVNGVILRGLLAGGVGSVVAAMESRSAESSLLGGIHAAAYSLSNSGPSITGRSGGLYKLVMLADYSSCCF